jgi:hypothetical protein
MAAWTIPRQSTRRRAPVGQADATKRPEEAGGRDRLERLLAEAELEKDALREVAKGKF